MSKHREFIKNALRVRFRELCGERSLHLAPEKFGEMKEFVLRVREQLQSETPANVKNSSTNGSAEWMESDADCLATLRALALGEKLRLHSGERPQLDSFMEALASSRNSPELRFQLLAERYSCPLNFAHPAEDRAREYVLMRLMSQDRALAERKGIEAIEAEDLLFRLNLIALHAARATDLRFIDALNYYYELLPAEWQPRSRHAWLLASYFALYARALLARVSER